MSATPIKITVKYVEPTAETRARMAAGWAYFRADLSKYLDREFWPKQRKSIRESRKNKEAAGAGTPTAGSEKTSCPYQI